MIVMNEVEYIFGLKHYDEYLSIRIDNIPIMPRVGENVTIPFFKAYIGTDLFYVESIHHEFEDGRQSIYIKLNSGLYNLFWHFRKDEAIEKEELAFNDFYKLHDYELKRKLGVKKW